MLLQDPSTPLSRALWSIDSRLTYVWLFLPLASLSGHWAPRGRGPSASPLSPTWPGTNLQWLIFHPWSKWYSKEQSHLRRGVAVLRLSLYQVPHLGCFGHWAYVCFFKNISTGGSSYSVGLLSGAHLKKSIGEFDFLSKPSLKKGRWTQISHDLASGRCLQYFLRNKSMLLRSWLFGYTVGQGTMVGRWINWGRCESLKAQERGETKAKWNLRKSLSHLPFLIFNSVYRTETHGKVF